MAEVTKSYDKPKVTIDLEEYNELLSYRDMNRLILEGAEVYIMVPRDAVRHNEFNHSLVNMVTTDSVLQSTQVTETGIRYVLKNGASFHIKHNKKS